jgi:hypothetical protein
MASTGSLQAVPICLTVTTRRQPQLAPRVTTLLQPISKDQPSAGVVRVFLYRSEEGGFVHSGRFYA